MIARFLLVLLVAAAYPVSADTNAVTRGLNWLAAQQRADGSWSTNAGLNALPVLAFLSAGHELDSRPHGDRLDKAIRFLLSQQTADGAFTNSGAMMYGHGMATLVLGEVAGTAKEGMKLRSHLDKAVRFILRAQAVEKGDIHTGGWRYFPDSKDSDLAVSIWQIAALRAALSAGVLVPREALERAGHYVTRCKRPDGAFAYQPGGLPNQGRTAAGILALQMCNQFEPSVAERGRAWLTAHPLRWEDEWFYHSAMFCGHIGAGFEESELVKRQLPDGSWPAPPGSVDEADAGPIYRTAVAVMALTAKHHYLPVFVVGDP